jgi:hypothetical protein
MAELRIRRLALALGLATLAAGRPAGAEDGAATLQGPRVRVTTAKGRLVGRVVTVRGEALVLERAGRAETIEIQRPEMLALEMSTRPGRRGRGAAIGALVGIGAAVAIGVAGGDTCTASPGPADWGNLIEKINSNLCFGHAETALLSGILTVPLGALLGVAIAPGEKWRPAGVGELSVQAGPSPGGGVGVRLTVGF